LTPAWTPSQRATGFHHHLQLHLFTATQQINTTIRKQKQEASFDQNSVG
jgi:hypothetical protein